MSSPAAGLTLLVNGTTPSRLYQRIADHIAARMPVPRLTVALFLRACPTTGSEGCVQWGSGMSNPLMYLDPAQLHLRVNLLNSEAHEIGHLEVESTFTDADRARFAYGIWHRPPIGWRDQLAACSLAESGFSPSRGKFCGDHSEAFEWAADAYRMCATGEWRGWDVGAWLGILPDFGFVSASKDNLRATRAPVIASCGLIREAASRAA